MFSYRFSDVESSESSVGDLESDNEEVQSRFTAFVKQLQKEIERVDDFRKGASPRADLAQTASDSQEHLIFDIAWRSGLSG